MSLHSLWELQTIVYKEYELNGYLKEWSNNFSNIPNIKYDMAEIGMIITEVAEVIECLTNPEQSISNVGFECADIIIRTLNFMSRKGLNASYYIEQKNKMNLVRGKLHGKQL